MIWHQPQEIAIVRRDDIGVPVESIVSGGYSGDLSHLWEYAALSSNVYENDDKLIVTDWERLDDSFVEIPQKRMLQKDIKGLKCWVYIKRADEKNTAVIAYRGTTSPIDFYSNFDWITRYIPFIRNLYAQVREQAVFTVEKLQKEFGDALSIVATGHSLGGGLAQQAAYATNAIKLVYAFDPSPVTGFSQVPKGERARNKQNVRVYRIFEHGEILAYLRLLMKASYSIKGSPNIDPEIIEIRLNFENKGNGVSQHGMYSLARSLKKVHEQCLKNYAEASITEAD